MYFPFYIAKRYLISKSSQNAVNIINWVTFLVIVIGAASLFIVLSGFAGLKTFSLSFSNSFDPDLKVLPAKGKFITFTAEHEQKLKEVAGIAAFSKELEERVFLTYRQKNHVAHLKGVDTQYARVTGIDSLVFFGEWFNQSKEVVTGIGISNLLGLGLNDYQNPLYILVPKPGKGSLSAQSKPYNEMGVLVSGVYSVTEELDKKYVFGSLSTVRELLDKNENQFSAINIKTSNSQSEAVLRDALTSVFGEGTVEVKNRAQLNDALYKMLNTENLAIYLIFTLVLIIALFNVAGAIMMMILDKRHNLKTLLNLGTTVKQLKRIFFVQGMLLVVIGGLTGIALGLAITWLQITFKLVMITPSLAYPMEIRFGNTVIVAATIFVLGLIASRISSGRISKRLLT